MEKCENSGSGMLCIAYPYASGDPAKDERVLSEGKKQPDALRGVWRYEIQIQEQGVVVQRVLRRYGG